MHPVETAAYLVSARSREMGLSPEAMESYIVPTWIFDAYFGALFGGETWDPMSPLAQEYVTYNSENDFYLVKQHPYIAFLSDPEESPFVTKTELSGIEPVQGLWAGAYDVSVNVGARSESAPPVYMRLVPTTYYDPQNPFGYRIALTMSEPLETVSSADVPDWLAGTWDTFFAAQDAETAEIPGILTFTAEGGVSLLSGDGEEWLEAYDGEIKDIEVMTTDIEEMTTIRIEWTLDEELSGEYGSFLPGKYEGVYCFIIGLQDNHYMRVIQVNGDGLFWSAVQNSFAFIKLQ
jgi:hypothetical protein